MWGGGSKGRKGGENAGPSELLMANNLPLLVHHQSSLLRDAEETQPWEDRGIQPAGFPSNICHWGWQGPVCATCPRPVTPWLLLLLLLLPLPPPWIRLRFPQIKLARLLAPSTVPAARSPALGELTSSDLFFSIAVCFIQDSHLFSRLLLPLGETRQFSSCLGAEWCGLGGRHMLSLQPLYFILPAPSHSLASPALNLRVDLWGTG